MLAKCLFADADLLLLDEPTRGVDVGAKTEIYDIIRNLADEGTSVAVFPPSVATRSAPAAAYDPANA